MNDKPDGIDDLHDEEGQADLDPGLALHMKLGGAGTPVEPDYSELSGHGQASSGPRRDEDIDTGVALHMKLGGAGDPIRPDDRPEVARVEGNRLCPGCNKIVEFKAGVCPECGFEFQRSSAAPPEFDSVPAVSAVAGGQVLKIVLIVALVAVLAFVVSRIDFASLGSGGDQGSTAETEYSEPFVAVHLDDEFHHTLSEQLMATEDAWLKTGVDAYVYRYGIKETLEPGKSQRIVINAYVGGADADSAIEEPGDQPFRLAMADYARLYSNRTAVDFSIKLQSTQGSAEVLESDKYVRWGYYYGLEHMTELNQVTAAIERYRQKEGELPHTLAGVSANMPLENRGFSFVASGWGYLPVFATDASGTVVFGTGSTKAELYPREITGYYLVRYLGSTGMGVDLWSEEEKTYYLNRITPLPCVQKSKLRNVSLTPDGEPDGIACVMHNGELLKN